MAENRELNKPSRKHDAKGGSKYAKKGKHSPKPSVKRGAPAFLYYVEGTDVIANKTPCERDPEATKDKPSMSSLGTWKNPSTGKRCKVTRVRNVVREVSDNNSEA